MKLRYGARVVDNKKADLTEGKEEEEELGF